MSKVRNGLNTEKIESVLSVQDLQQEVHHSVMHFANFVQTFVMPHHCPSPVEKDLGGGNGI